MSDTQPVVLPPPATHLAAWRNMLAALVQSCISSPLDLAVSLLGLVALYLMARHLLSWAVFDSVFTREPGNCQLTTGACWSVLRARWRIIMFGLYPDAEQWRSALASIVAIVTLALACVPRMWTAMRMMAIWLAGYAIFLLLIHGGIFCLTSVPSSRWGGFTLTLFIYITIIAFGLPTAIGIALVRQSRFIAFRLLMGFVVDMTRSLPLLTILFAANVIIPIMLPAFLQDSKLTRTLIGFALFFACYQSEIVRGGLQALSQGQREAANALGLGYWRTMGLILLPQAFRIAMPATINQFVISFKETSLVVIVGLFDLMASAQAAYQTGKWSGYYKEVYVFVALIYFLGSFCLSKYGKYVERRFAVKR